MFALKICVVRGLCCPDQYPFSKVDRMGKRIGMGIYSECEAVFD